MKPTRVALITGAAKRVGRCIALRLAGEGFDIAITYLSSQADATEVCEQVRAAGRKGVAIKADLTQPHSATAHILKKFKTHFSRMDVLVNNASLYEPDNDDEAQLARFWSIHVESPRLLSRAFAPMLKSARGAVINMVDLQAEIPLPGYLRYCASKAGLLNLTRGLARELAPQVRVNGISPGVVEWPPGFPEAQKRKYLSRVPLARAGTPQDVAETVIFFSTTAQYVTGQILHVDGGRSIT
jgi:pteridine reductase